MAITNSPNMNLPIPVVGSEAGPQYATDINSSLTILDQHNHTPGSGVQITPAGLNISSDLTLISNNLTDIRTLRFTPQLSGFTPTTSDIGCLYEVSEDLYFRDGAGNQVRITQSGSVAGASGTITGLPSGTASASYSAGTFVFQSATSTSANVDGGSFVLRNNTASSFGLTLAPPNAMGSNSTITLPTIPVMQNIMMLDNSGNISAQLNVDNSSLQISTNTISVKSGGIIQSALAARAVGPSVGAGGVAVSNPSGVITIVSSTPTQIFQVNLTTTGRPVMIGLRPNGTSELSISGASDDQLVLTISRAGSTIGYFPLRVFSVNSSTSVSLAVPVSVVHYLDFPAAGSYSYTVEASVTGSGFALGKVAICELYAYEI